MRYSTGEDPLRPPAYSAAQHLGTLKWASIALSLVALGFLLAIVCLSPMLR
jgi:hypothetical protein